MKLDHKTYSALLCAIILTGCGTTSGGSSITAGDPSTTPRSENYTTLDSTEAVTSTLAGVATRTGYTGDTITTPSEVTTLSGTLQHDTRAHEITDGTYTLTDPDGLNESDELDDGIGYAVNKINEMAPDGDYNYIGVYTYVYTADDEDFVGTYVLGAATLESDMPTAGSASYSGQSVGYYAASTGEGYNFFGDSSITANFGAGTANVTLSNFDTTSDATGDPTALPADTISINGMSIDGSHMSGGAMVSSLNGSDVDLLGENAVIDSEAQMFGYDDQISAPDEVGGILQGEGDDGYIQTVYIAD